MDFNATIDLIIRELEEARDIVDDLKKIDGAPELEIELAKSKIRNAGEIIALLKHKKEEHTAPWKKEHTPLREESHASFKPEERAAPRYEELKYVEADSPLEHKSPSPEPEPVIRKTEPEKETVKSSQPNRKSEQVHPQGMEKKEAELLEGKKKIKEQETLEIVSDEEKDPGKPDVEKSDTKPFVAPIIADTFSHLANRFNEQIGEKQVDDFSYTHGRHYTNLADAIGLNDRFYFIREMFDGDRDAYNEMIGKLEKAANLSEAKEIIMSHRKGKNEAAKHLLDVVKRKFASNE